MTIYLDSADVRALCSPEVALEASEAVLAAQKAGRSVLPPRLDVNLDKGFFRVMPAAVDGHMGAKIMSLVRGVGNRYLLLLYSQETGDLRAILDADEVTRLRTAATTVAAGRVLCPEGTARLGLIGSGFEAEGHLRAFAQAWPLTEVQVYSPSIERRTAFAAKMTEELGLTVTAAESAESVLRSAPVSVLCTKASTPVVNGDHFPPGAVVLSIGSTRPDLRELDERTLERSRALVVDDARQVVAESGDVAAGLASGAIAEDRIFDLAAWNPALPSEERRDLLTFKSVGTAAQDLVLAAVLVKRAQAEGLGRSLGELTSLKRTGAKAVIESTVGGAR